MMLQLLCLILLENQLSRVIPIASKLPNLSGAFIAIIIPLHIKIANSIITIVQPIKPNSSAKTEKIKSL